MTQLSEGSAGAEQLALEFGGRTHYGQLIAPYLADDVRSCSFCDYLHPLVLLEGRFCYLTLAIGQIVRGYAQICPYAHRTSAAALEAEEVSEVLTMKALVRKAFVTVYGSRGVVIENGRPAPARWGAATAANARSLDYHTHIHCIPAAVDIRPDLRRVATEYAVGSMDDLRALRTETFAGGPYMFFETVEGEGYVYPIDGLDLPSQFLRTCVARRLGVEERGDWRRHPGMEMIAEARRELVPVVRVLWEQTGDQR